MQSEFEFIQHLKEKYSLKAIGDDCAVVPRDAQFDTVLTADMLVEDIDFRLEWTTPEFLGYKALAVSVSDIAAMGADPVWALLSVALPEVLWKSDFLDRFYEGWFELACDLGIELIGGDISRAPDRLVIDSTVGGEVAKGRAILRSGAAAGDLLFVTGALGGSAGGLQLLESGTRYSGSENSRISEVILKQLRPTPQIVASNLLQTRSLATAMIDLSDGLSSDLVHLMDASGTGCRLDRGKIPVEAALGTLFKAEAAASMALDGGEDYELLFSVCATDAQAVIDLGFICIGEVTSDHGQHELISRTETRSLRPRGYQHFGD
ncbi:MAG: thiamine-phosphate kinase [Pyrinomonadaceae bacterium]